MTRTGPRTDARLAVHDSVSPAPDARVLYDPDRVWKGGRLYHEPGNLAGIRRGASSLLAAQSASKTPPDPHEKSTCARSAMIKERGANAPCLSLPFGPAATRHLVRHAMARPRRAEQSPRHRSRPRSRHAPRRHSPRKVPSPPYAARNQESADPWACEQTFRALPEHSRPPVSSIHLVEASEQLRGVQKLKLATTGFAETKTVWYGDIKEVPACESLCRRSNSTPSGEHC